MLQNPMAGSHYLSFLNHEDEAQKVGRLYIPQDGGVLVKDVYHCEEYESPGVVLSKADARADYAKHRDELGWDDEPAFESVRNHAEDGGLPLFYYPEVDKAYLDATQGCRGPGVSPWKEACQTLRRWGRDRNYAQTLTNLRALRALRA